MNSVGAQILLFAAAVVAAALAALRWLRVAQREHYLPGSVVVFARRWWSIGPNRLLGVAALLGLVGAAAKIDPAGLVTAAAVAVGPFGLSPRGRTAPLKWTRRLTVLAATTGLIAAVFMAVAEAVVPGWRVAAASATLVAVAMPLAVDLALAVTAPLERLAGAKYVRRAAEKIKAVRPTVVAITGSYGKTSTKGYVAHLLSGSFTVVPSPRSFNNQSGLSRAINENLGPGTDVFVAEMGTYGPGEIAEMCSWLPPDIAVITAIGPVHLERMKSEENIAAAKAEIFERAPVVVLNTDNEWLVPLATSVVAAGKKLWRCSAVDRSADVCAVADGDALRVYVAQCRPGDAGGSREIALAQGLDAPAGNVACAVAVALELGVAPETIAKRLQDLPVAPHRRQVSEGATGATIIDDTYNANPAGAAGALQLLARLSGLDGDHKRVVVTPGMVELGDRQDAENERFAEEAARLATHLLVIGHTNARSLVAGWTGAGDGIRAELLRFATRPQAVEWVTRRVGPGDVVLYENDLPDHFP
jgi:UDP-N-acetylmuramoyl-tripeptide--D-alanyl-D-alanine ligase